MSVLGTDGFGRSDTREALRSFFEVDAAHVVVTVLNSLARDGEIAARSSPTPSRRSVSTRTVPTRPTPTRVQPGSAVDPEIVSPGTLWITGESEVDDLVNTDPSRC